MPAIIQAFFDPVTATVTYVVHEDAPGGACAIIDSVLDYDPKSGRTSTAGADRVIEYVRQHGLRTDWLLETHAHADHLGRPYLQKQLGGVIAIGGAIRAVQGVFKRIFNLEPGFALDGSQFGRLFADGETFRIGALEATAIHVPGHTPADMAYRWATPPSSATRCSCRTWARRAATSWRRRAPAVPLHPAAAGPARRHAPVHVPRLSAGGTRGALADHGGRAAPGQHPRARRHQ